MMRIKTVWIVTLMLALNINLSAQDKGFITVKGKEILGADRQPFLIKGTNLGNWLIPEGYMFKFKSVNSPRLINQAISELLGPDEARVFWEKYLRTYIGEGDIHYLKTIGVNSIRIPF